MSRRIKTKERKRLKKLKFIKLFSFIALVLVISGGLILSTFDSLSFLPNNSSTTEKEEVVETMSSPPKPSKLTINAVGDVMAHNPQLKAQYDSSSNTYSFENNFKYVKSYMEKSDISIANLETTLAGSSIPYSSYPAFNSPDALADGLKYAGVDIISTINNHSFDKGDLGVERTLEVLKEKGFSTVGTVKNPEDNNYIIKEVNSINLGITSFSYGELKDNTKYLNGIRITDNSKDKMNVIDMYNADKAFDTISKVLKNIQNTDLQVVIIHWGNEYQRVPSEYQKKLAQMLSNAGVDIIIGSHPHVVQPVEMIKSSDGSNDTLVIYSLGNFLSNQRKELLSSPYTEDGLMVEIELAKNSLEDKAKISKVTCIPTWVNKYQANGKDVYEIIPIADKNELDKIENIPLDRVKASYDNTALQVIETDIIKLAPNPFE